MGKGRAHARGRLADGEPNQMQLRELLQKVEKLREDLSMAARGAVVEDSAAPKAEEYRKS